MQSNNQFMKGLRLMRKKRGLKAEQVSSYIGINVYTYRNYEYGKREAGYLVLLRLAEYFNCHVEDLF